MRQRHRPTSIRARSSIAAYGLATAVSASESRKQHFPSDVVVGGAIGWLMAGQVYAAHHDPEVGGGGLTSLSGTTTARTSGSQAYGIPIRFL